MLHSEEEIDVFLWEIREEVFSETASDRH